MAHYGYVRVSAKDQNPDRQLSAMHEQQIAEKNIYLDKISGKDFSRPAYLRLIKRLKKGDVVVIKSIDRLGRNYGEILEEWRKITKEIGADIEVLDMPLLNTDTQRENLTGVFYFGSDITDSRLCGRNGTGFYQAAAGRGDSDGKEQGNTVRPPQGRTARQV